MRIPRRLYDELVAHALEDAPNECCGLLGTRDGEAVSVHRAVNKFASPLRFEIDERELWDIFERIDGEGQFAGVLYHSHTRSAPEPSQTDVNFGSNPMLAGVTWLIVGLQGDEPEVRAWRIADGRATETELQVV
jgi:[CysO sulfur-carrier protein]-S-L-cysteine hydrolase